MEKKEVPVPQEHEDQGEGLGYYVNELNSYGFTWGKQFLSHGR